MFILRSTSFNKTDVAEFFHNNERTVYPDHLQQPRFLILIKPALQQFCKQTTLLLLKVLNRSTKLSAQKEDNLRLFVYGY